MLLSLQGRLDNTPLPYKEGLMAVKEAVVNSIQAIDLAGINDGNVIVSIYRMETQKLSGIDTESRGPIDSFEIEDNGIGFNDANFKAFNCLDYSEKKARFGCKGMGRLMWLKAFSAAQIDSAFMDDGRLKNCLFQFSVKDDVKELGESKRQWEHAGTCVRLMGFRNEYEKQSKKRFEAICNDILSHCIQYFAVDSKVKVVVKEEDGTSREIGSLLRDKTIRKDRAQVKIGEVNLEVDLILVEAGLPINSGMFWCANGRVARIDTKIFRNHPIFNDALVGGEKLLCIVQSEYLDANVRPEREGFVIPEKSTKNDSAESLIASPSFDEMSEGIWPCAEKFLGELIKDAKIENDCAVKRALEEFPEYKPLQGLLHSVVIPPNASSAERKKILRTARQEIDDKAEKNIENVAQKIKGENCWEDVEKLQVAILSEVAIASRAADLASYVAKRKAVLTCFQKALRYNGDGKHNKEAVLHNLIVPMRIDSSSNRLSEANLWLIDDRLAFHSYLASDLPLCEWKSFFGLEGDKNRPDVAVFKNFWKDAPALSIDKTLPFVVGQDTHGELTIIEFKRPGRTDKDCIDQVKTYITRLNGQDPKDVVTFDGRPLKTKSNIDAYVVLDISSEFHSYLEKEDFVTVEGGHLYRIYSNLRAVIHVLSFDKMLELARQRNVAFFKQLGID